MHENACLHTFPCIPSVPKEKRASNAYRGSARSLRDYAISVSLSIDQETDDDGQMKNDHQHAREEDVLILMNRGVHNPEDVGSRQ